MQGIVKAYIFDSYLNPNKMNNENFSELEKVVFKYFPNAEWNQNSMKWEGKTSPNRKDEWGKPEALESFDKEVSKKFYSYMSGSGWDDTGNISISVRQRIFM